jgi:hypothetical protein
VTEDCTQQCWGWKTSWKALFVMRKLILHSVYTFHSFSLVWSTVRSSIQFVLYEFNSSTDAKYVVQATPSQESFSFSHKYLIYHRMQDIQHYTKFIFLTLHKNRHSIAHPVMMGVSLGVSVGECEDVNEEEIVRVDSYHKILVMNDPVHEHFCSAWLVTNKNVAHNHTISS